MRRDKKRLNYQYTIGNDNLYELVKNKNSGVWEIHQTNIK